jgi:hypothetical protein
MSRVVSIPKGGESSSPDKNIDPHYDDMECK